MKPSSKKKETADLAVPAFKCARDRGSITEDEVAACRAAGLKVRLRRGEDGTIEAEFRTAVLPMRADARLLPLRKHEGPFRVSGNAVDDLCDECGERHEGVCEGEA